MEVLRTVEDPELGMDIVDLGLLYEVEVEDSTAKIVYSLTSMGCPAGPLIAQDIDSAARRGPPGRYRAWRAAIQMPGSPLTSTYSTSAERNATFLRSVVAAPLSYSKRSRPG